MIITHLRLVRLGHDLASLNPSLGEDLPSLNPSFNSRKNRQKMIKKTAKMAEIELKIIYNVKLILKTFNFSRLIIIIRRVATLCATSHHRFPLFFLYVRDRNYSAELITFFLTIANSKRI